MSYTVNRSSDYDYTREADLRDLNHLPFDSNDPYIEGVLQQMLGEQTRAKATIQWNMENPGAQIAKSGENDSPDVFAASLARVEEEGFFEQGREARVNAADLVASALDDIHEMETLSMRSGANESGVYKSIEDDIVELGPKAQMSGSNGGTRRTAGNPLSESTHAKAQADFETPSTWNNLPDDVKAQNWDFGKFMELETMSDITMKAHSEVLENENKGKKLMLMFFYLAKFAASGDPGMMYQFMKFLTYIISKDKAKQQIELGKKLIQLQDLSRRWTNELLSLKTDSNDATASSELMKTMTIVKSKTDEIAMSQKLISQMMEEFAQVVETLTNTTKAALEANGRILRTVSQFR